MLFRLKREGRPERTLELSVTPTQVLRWMVGEPLWASMPALTYDQREFLLSGASPDDLESILKIEPLPTVLPRTFMCELRELMQGDTFTIFANGELYTLLGPDKEAGRYFIANQDGLTMAQDGVALIYPVQRGGFQAAQTAWAQAAS